MGMGTIEETVTGIVGRITKAPLWKISLDTDLKTELNVDSLQGLQIVAAIEKRYGFTLPNEDLDSYTSVRAIADLVRRMTSDEGTPAA